MRSPVGKSVCATRCARLRKEGPAPAGAAWSPGLLSYISTPPPTSVPPETTDSPVSDSENPSPNGAPADRPGPPDDEKEEALEAPLRERLSEVCHDLNNSLAVISGNAQLLAELARAEDLGPAFTDPLDDVEAARADISDALDRLNRLRAQADQWEDHG